MLQDVENIGRIIRNAKLFNPRLWETRAMQQDDTLQDCAAIVRDWTTAT
ncbi:MAG: hypothetical protein R2851_15385 [Caldilineaceae bacterium]